MKNKIEQFLQRNLAVLLLLQVAFTFMICEYIIIPCLNISSTILFFVGIGILIAVVNVNWALFKKFILTK